MEQRTTEWYLARKGRFTASDISKLLTASKKKGEVFGEAAMSYIYSKVNEAMMLDNAFIEFINEYPLSTPALRWGNMLEADARELYSARTGAIVIETGFFEYGDHAGGSPDGVIPSENGIIEIKCPFVGDNHIHHKAIMFIDYRFNDKFQAIARIYRFMQKYPVDLYLVYAESEGEIYKSFMQKWAQHNEMISKMVGIVRGDGLFGSHAEEKMMRWMFARREERSGKLWKAINNDNVLECQKMDSNSVDLIVTSIPFSNHYEYTPTYNDFGHNEDNDKFFDQMDYLTPELMRILRPGRLACIHVKDRVLFGSATGDGMPTIDPFSEMTVFHYMRHGFRYMGRITVDTDVVRENNQTYRLGYTEMCKDGSKMGVGCPEYILLFRKLPSDTSRAYADIPVVKDKKDYSLARWQIDAHASWKSSGDTLLSYEDMRGAGIDQIRHLFRNYQRDHVYDFNSHVSFAEELEAYDKLPRTFMAIDPVSKKDHIWDDVTRMRTLNTRQSQKNKQNHICPLQLDIVERLIGRYSNKEDLVFDPFGGIQTVPYCAVKMGRRGLSTELNYDYWKDGIAYLMEAENEVSAPTLFDLMAI